MGEDGRPLPGRLLLVASHLGRFNGAYLAGRPLPDHPWLSRDDAREWVERCAEWVPGAIRDLTTWQRPALRRDFPVPVTDGLVRLWEERERLLTALDQLPRTLCPFGQRKQLGRWGDQRRMGAVIDRTGIGTAERLEPAPTPGRSVRRRTPTGAFHDGLAIPRYTDGERKRPRGRPGSGPG